MLKRMLTCGLLAITLFPGLVGPASAGPNANAKILLHLLAPTTKNACGRSQATPDCSEIVTAGALSPQTYFAYLLVTDADSTAGVAGIQCGIAYNDTANAGVDIFSWTNCATLEFTSTGWPASGGGNLITWDATSRCQRFQPGGAGTSVTAVAGYFYCAAYDADTLKITPRPIDGVAKVAACDSDEDVVQSGFAEPESPHLGSAVFSLSGINAGFNPCTGSSELPPATTEAQSPIGLLAYIRLNSLDSTSLMHAAQTVSQQLGFQISIGFGADGIIAWIPGGGEQLAAIESDSRVAEVATGPVHVHSGEAVSFSADHRTNSRVVWNKFIKEVSQKSSELVQPTRAGGRPHLDLPAQYRSCSVEPPKLDRFEDLRDVTATDGEIPDDKDKQTNSYLIGSVGLTLIFPESNSESTDTPVENWAPGQIDDAIVRVMRGLYRLSEAASLHGVPLNFWLSDEEIHITESSMEPMNYDSHSNGWREEAMDQLGYGHEDVDGAYRLCNDRRGVYGSDWWYVLYVVNDVNDVNGVFPDGSLGFTLGEFSPWATCAFGAARLLSLSNVVAHETCHVFGAQDESECTLPLQCEHQSGYLHGTNGNCGTCGNTNCLMKLGTDIEFCDFTLKQIGWLDSDGSSFPGSPDPIDSHSGVHYDITHQGVDVDPGDCVDIYSVDGEWIKRIFINASNWDSDSHAAIWDGLDYNGDAPIGGAFMWHKNGSSTGYLQYFRIDEETPQITYTGIGSVTLPPSLGSYTFHYCEWDFTDEDTHAVNGTITVWKTWDSSLIPYYRSAPQCDVEGSARGRQWFFVKDSGRYKIVLDVWDIGGGHHDQETMYYDLVGASGVAEVTSQQVMKLSTAHVNPSVAGAVWSMQSKKESDVSVEIVDVQGRLVSSRQLHVRLGGMEVTWDGKTGTGERVRPGKYYLVVRGDGIRTNSSVVVVR